LSLQPRSFAEALAQRCASDPDGELLRVAGRPGLSAGEVYERSRAIARGLARFVSAGDTVATALARGPEAVTLTAALSLLGVVELALPHGVEAKAARRIASASACRHVITDGERLRADPYLAELGNAARLATIVTDEDGPNSLESLIADGTTLPNRSPELSDPASIMLTSGTTGTAKGALLPNGAGLAQAARVRAAMQYDASDVLFNFFPWQHINARHAAFLPAVLCGGRLVLGEQFSASRFWSTAYEEGVTAFNFMGAVCAMLLRQPASETDRSHRVRRAYGGPAPAWLVDEMAGRFGVELRQAYACTELADVALTADEIRPGAAGRPSEDYDLRIAGPDGAAVPDGEPGTLLVRPRRDHLTFRAYVGDPDATAAAWQDGWFRTGDRARLEDGWLYFEGRSAEVIRRRGLNIAPVQVEETVLTMAGVADAAAVGVASELTEEEILLVVVPAPGATLTPEEIRAHCAAHLPRHAVPRYVSVEAAVPRNASLKILRALLRDRGLPPTAWDADARERPFRRPPSQEHP
jgi:crotonobetaine/carnitine-CoA ligase